MKRVAGLTSDLGTVTSGLLAFHECLPANYSYLGPLLGTQVFGSSTGELFVIFVGSFLLTELSIPWQYFLITLSVPMIIVLTLAPVLLDETPHFYLVKGSKKEALEVLNKIARTNSSFLPENINLVLRKSSEKQFDKESHWAVFRTTLKRWTFLKVWIPLLSIAATVKMISDGFSFVITELLYVNGETYGEYCNGVRTQIYNLTKEDYIKLSLSQLCIILSVPASYAIFKFNVALKTQGLIFFSINILLILVMYCCPREIAAISILAFIRINIKVIHTTSRLEQLKLRVPTEVQGTIFGLSGAIKSALVPFYPLLTQLLSKISMHYVTTVTLIISLIGLTAFIVLPFDLNKEIWDTEQLELEDASVIEKK